MMEKVDLKRLSGSKWRISSKSWITLGWGQILVSGLVLLDRPAASDTVLHSILIDRLALVWAGNYNQLWSGHGETKNGVDVTKKLKPQLWGGGFTESTVLSRWNKHNQKTYFPVSCVFCFVFAVNLYLGFIFLYSVSRPLLKDLDLDISWLIKVN